MVLTEGVGPLGIPEIADRLIDDASWPDPYPTYRALRDRSSFFSVPDQDGFIALG